MSLYYIIFLFYSLIFNFSFFKDFLDSVRAPALFAELEDDEEIVEDDDMPDDDENEDEQEYEEVMVSRNLLTMVKNKMD